MDFNEEFEKSPPPESPVSPQIHAECIPQLRIHKPILGWHSQKSTKIFPVSIKLQLIACTSDLYGTNTVVSLLAIQRSDRSHVSRNSALIAWDAKTGDVTAVTVFETKRQRDSTFFIQCYPLRSTPFSIHITWKCIIWRFKVRIHDYQKLERVPSIQNDTSGVSMNKSGYTVCPAIATYTIQCITRTSIICMFKGLTSWLRGDWRDPVYSA